jgi:hypothetical protein
MQSTSQGRPIFLQLLLESAGQETNEEDEDEQEDDDEHAEKNAHFTMVRQSARLNDFCADCRRHSGPVFMINDDIWATITFPWEREVLLLCLACTETRLRRPLVLSDFIPHAPCNDWVYVTLRKRQRRRPYRLASHAAITGHVSKQYHRNIADTPWLVRAREQRVRRVLRD